MDRDRSRSPCRENQKATIGCGGNHCKTWSGPKVLVREPCYRLRISTEKEEAIVRFGGVAVRYGEREGSRSSEEKSLELAQGTTVWYGEGVTTRYYDLASPTASWRV